MPELVTISHGRTRLSVPHALGILRTTTTKLGPIHPARISQLSCLIYFKYLVWHTETNKKFTNNTSDPLGLPIFTLLQPEVPIKFVDLEPRIVNQKLTGKKRDITYERQRRNQRFLENGRNPGGSTERSNVLSFHKKSEALMRTN